MPQELVVLNGGAATPVASRDVAVAAQTSVTETSTVAVATSLTARDKAKMQGYEGEGAPFLWRTWARGGGKRDRDLGASPQAPGI